jgi:transcription elongation factor SPT6
LGGLLQIGGKFKYADLDELIYLHVRAMATKVEEMMAHEKFKGTEEELLTFLRNFQMVLASSVRRCSLMRGHQANPDKPAYGFSIDKKHPGQFNLTFITSKGTQPKTWV